MPSNIMLFAVEGLICTTIEVGVFVHFVVLKMTAVLCVGSAAAGAVQ